MTVAPGTTHELARLVTDDRTADALGNRGVKVFATPFLVGLLEETCNAMLLPGLPSESATVGTMVEMKHLAATPVGLTVRTRATLLEADGRRFLFAVEAWDDREKVAEGRHERYVVPDLQKFLARAQKKAEP
jgi:fluoroacetyl-CoA thioesterase